MVEFALVVPMLATFIGGIITVSWVLMSHAALVDAVSEGSRRASVTLRDPLKPGEYETNVTAIADNEVKDAAERAGWKRDDVVVAIGFEDRGGVSHVTIRGTAPLSSRFSGILFPVPFAISYQTTLATLDQP
ncbi:MAG: TadE family protein [Myxococcota bacterium]